MAPTSPFKLDGEKPGAGAFKRKLDALGYTNKDGTADTPLMRQVVDDLIHTTDCYLALKQQASSGIQHLNHLTDKVTVLAKDSERLAAENNHLHLRTIQETEKHKSQERVHLTMLRKLEDTVAELGFYKSSSAERHAAMEKENAGLRAKTQELLHDLDAHQRADSDGEEISHRPLRLDMAEPLLQRVAIMPRQPGPINALAENVDILRATEHRVASLEALLKEKEAQLDSARQDVEQLQEAVTAREAEIIRLGREAGQNRNVDELALQHRCEGQESLILQLTEQVDMLKATAADAEAEAARREDATLQLAQSDRARVELELKLKNALRDNASASREVKTMRATLKTLQLSRLRHSSSHSAKQQRVEISESATRALELAEQRLAEAAAELQRRSAVLEEVSAEKDAALAKVAFFEGQVQSTTPETSGGQQSTGKAATVLTGAVGASPKQTDAQQLSDQIRFLSDERAVLAEDLARATARAERLEQQQAQALAHHEALRAELAEAQKQAHSMVTAMQTMAADKDKKSERLKAAEAEADALRQALTRQAAGGKPADEERCRQAEQLLAQQLGVCNRVTEELAQAKHQAGTASQRASAMEAECSRLQQGLQSSREAQEAATGRAHALQHELQGTRDTSEGRSREVAQLREVSVQADQALQQCMAQLQALRADAEAKAGMLERAAEAQQCLQAEVNRLKQAYTRERDLAKASQEDNTLWKSKAKAKEEELKDAMQHQKLLQEAVASAEALSQDAQQHQRNTAQENAALKQEIQAIAEDLEALVKENQIIGHQLVAITAERDRWQADMAAIAERAQHAETLARCRDAEALQLRREQEVLLTEHRLMERNYVALQEDFASCQGELAARCDDLEVLRDAHAAAEAQVAQQSQDLQAWEQQVASLSRQVANVTSEQEDAQRERQILLDSLRASEQAKFHQEQVCQQLQQRAAGLSAKVHSLTGRCEDAEADAQALQHRLGLEAERVADLEILLGRLRASQFHLQGSTQRGLGAHSATLAGFEGDAKAHARASRRAASLEASLASAEAKAAALQASVRELQAENTSLGASLSAVRAERNALNAAVRASTSRNGLAGPSDHTESSAALASARADAAHLREENTRLLDLLSTVDAERSALDRENWALRGAGVFSDDSNQDVGVAAGDKAAQLALELARERSQRQKAESDFEELLENLERQARHPDSPLWKGAEQQHCNARVPCNLEELLVIGGRQRHGMVAFRQVIESSQQSHESFHNALGGMA
ncbi:g11509 [Coccomyxa viridis]|uniref:G11509 protein n=1 Tax=Coccomyxa viridis TaxID=1274662 RepID=A0ABP1GC90_9CHLO